MASINWSNVTDFGQITAEANNVTGGSFWASMFYMLWIILILISIAFGFEVGMLVASFIMFVLGILMVYAGLMSWTLLLPMPALILIIFLYIIYTSKKIRT